MCTKNIVLYSLFFLYAGICYYCICFTIRALLIKEMISFRLQNSCCINDRVGCWNRAYWSFLFSALLVNKARPANYSFFFLLKNNVLFFAYNRHLLHWTTFFFFFFQSKHGIGNEKQKQKDIAHCFGVEWFQGKIHLKRWTKNKKQQSFCRCCQRRKQLSIHC